MYSGFMTVSHCIPEQLYVTVKFTVLLVNMQLLQHVQKTGVICYDKLASNQRVMNVQ